MAWRGKSQLGTKIMLGCLCVDGNGTPTNPTAAPSIDIFAGNTLLSAGGGVPRMDPGNVTGLFQFLVFLDSTYAVGRYTAVYRWNAGSFQGQDTDDFEVVAGGTSDGTIISMYYLERPHAAFLAHQTDSPAGLLTFGKNPGV